MPARRPHKPRRQSGSVSRTAKRGVAFLAPVGLEIRSLRDGALDPDFRWLSSVFNWALRHKTPYGKRLLTFNPLHDCKWPREKNENVLRPIASQDRYARTLAEADAIDLMGRLRLALALARYTARRIDAVLHRASDVLLTSDSVRRALASAGHDERLADSYAFGAIRWRAEHNKKGVERITPIADAARAELDRYLSLFTRLEDVPLLPSVEDETRPLARTVATKWLAKAERRAELPKLRGGLWHEYGRLWATECRALPDVDVAEAGGWTGPKAMKLAYQRHTPAGVVAAVLNAT